MKVADCPGDERTQHQRYAPQNDRVDGCRDDQEQQCEGECERCADRAQRKAHRAMFEKLLAADDADEIAVEACDQNKCRHPRQPLHQDREPIRGQQENGVESLRVTVMKQPLHDVGHLVRDGGIDIRDRYAWR